MSSQSTKRLRQKGRQTTGTFIMFPTEMLLHENFRTLSPRATKYVVDLASNYNGRNNGDLSATFSQMKSRGWNSSDQLFKAKRELVDRGIIKISRQGGLNKCNLYALNWFQIDECDGKLDISPTQTAPKDWKNISILKKD